MESEMIRASVFILGKDFQVQSVKLHREIGQLGRGQAQIHPLGGLYKTISEDDVETLAKEFKDAILNKDDAEENVEVTLSKRGNMARFHGFLTSCDSAVNGEGSASFSVSFAEINYVLSSMSLAAYPSGEVELHGALARPNARHPYTRIANPSGDIAERIRTLFKTAKTYASKLSEDNPVDRVMAQHRKANEKYENIFNSLLDRSSMNPYWLDSVGPQVSMQINDVIAYTLFDSGLDAWQALMRLAHQFNLIYVGGFGQGGYFKTLELESGGCNLNDSYDSVNARTFHLGKSLEQSVGQVIAIHPNKTPSKDMSGVFKYAGGSKNKVAGMYPEEPKPANGKIVMMRAPSYFAATIEPVADKNDPFDGKTEAEAESTAEKLRDNHEKTQDAVEKNSALVDRWCEDMYRIMRTRNVKTTVVKPIERESCEVGDSVTVGSFEGVLNSTSITVNINGDTGSARAVYNVAYIQP